jgi:putative ABC transport system substrate-binding protein
MASQVNGPSRRRFAQGLWVAGLALVAGVGLLVGCGILPPQAQQPKTVRLIGYLSSQDPVSESTRAEGIRLALRELGYIEGQNIAFEYRYSGGKADQASEPAAELVRLKPDVIVVAGGLIWIAAAKDATRTIPIVMVGTGNDPVEAGLIESLGRPGGNVTGLANLTGKLAGKRLELLKDAVPSATRIAVLYEPATPANLVEVNEDLPIVARALNLTVRPWEIRTADNLERVFAALSSERPDGLHDLGSPLLNHHAGRIASFALEIRLPSVHSTREAVEAGGLIYYGADRTASYQRVAAYVDRILKGARRPNCPWRRPRASSS